MTAKKEVNAGSTSLKRFFDELVTYIIEFRVRVVAGDFNMALWTVVPELRARGLQANLAAWFPWKMSYASQARMDSCCVILIGGTQGIRKVYDPSVLEMDVPAMPLKWSNVKDQKTKGPYILHTFTNGQGYQLSAYHPKTAVRKTFVRWTFQPSLDRCASAKEEIWDHVNRDQALFKFLFLF